MNKMVIPCVNAHVCRRLAVTLSEEYKITDTHPGQPDRYADLIEKPGAVRNIPVAQIVVYPTHKAGTIHATAVCSTVNIGNTHIGFCEVQDLLLKIRCGLMDRTGTGRDEHHRQNQPE